MLTSSGFTVEAPESTPCSACRQLLQKLVLHRSKAASQVQQELCRRTRAFALPVHVLVHELPNQVAFAGILVSTAFARHLVAYECLQAQPASIDALRAGQPAHRPGFAKVPGDILRPLFVLMIDRGIFQPHLFCGTLPCHVSIRKYHGSLGLADQREQSRLVDGLKAFCGRPGARNGQRGFRHKENRGLPTFSCPQNLIVHNEGLGHRFACTLQLASECSNLRGKPRAIL